MYYSAIEIDLYLFYRRNLIATLELREKMIGHRTRLRENDD